MSMRKGEWHQVNGKFVRIRHRLVGTNELVGKRPPGRPPKATLNGLIQDQQALTAILDKGWERLSVAEKIAALDPRKR